LINLRHTKLKSTRYSTDEKYSKVTYFPQLDTSPKVLAFVVV